MAITEFNKDFRFLSNFYPSEITYKGKVYATVEHAFQSLKMLNSEDKEAVQNARTAGVAKRMGGKLPRRPDWEDIKYSVMEKTVRAKFNQVELLRRKLLDTEDEELIEGNSWHDNTWGDCYCSKCKKTEGKNWLGKILMTVRKELQEKYE